MVKCIDIILPYRIGDSVMSLPAVLCLKQLIEKLGNKDYKVTLYSSNAMTQVFQELGLFDVKQMNIFSKIKSSVKMADFVFFLHTSSKNIGFCGKKTFGEHNQFKKQHRYDVDMPYLNPKNLVETFSSDLFLYLREKYGFSYCTIGFFGMILELGFTVDDIKNCFHFDSASLSLSLPESPIQGDYAVFCLEAAYGSKRACDRRWDTDNYFEIAEKLHSDFGLKSVFVGIGDKPLVPDKDYFIDKRGALNLYRLASLFQGAKLYIGNDTGPLHVANLVKLPTVAAYFVEPSLYEYSPLFLKLNTPVFNPKNTEAIASAVVSVLKG